jgi:hypothetical protein
MVLGDKEARAAARKILRCPARVTLPGTVTIKARTFDVSMAGMSVIIDNPLPLNERYQIEFETLAGGKVLKFNITARAIHCSLSGTDGFRVGFHFEKNDEATLKAIRQLLS